MSDRRGGDVERYQYCAKRNVLAGRDMRESSTEGQTRVSRTTPGLPTSDGCLVDNAIGEAEDDQKNHHVHSMAILHSVHEGLLVQRHWR